MDNKVFYWHKSNLWGIKEFVLLLLIEFILVIGIIKFLIKPIYYSWFENELYAGTSVGLTIAVTLLISIYYVALKPKNLDWKKVGLVKPNSPTIKLIFWLSLVVIVGSSMIMVCTSFIGNTVENDKVHSIQQDINAFTILISFVSAVIISPIYEEIFYRGFIYRWLRTRISMRWAVVISSFIFTIAHIPTYNVMPINFFSGIIFALAYERTNSIWPAIIVHALTNAVWLLLTLILS